MTPVPTLVPCFPTSASANRSPIARWAWWRKPSASPCPAPPRLASPRLAQATKTAPQALHHLLATADWSVQALRACPCLLGLDASGDRQQAKTTDNAAHPSIGNVQTLANGVVSVAAYGVLDSVTFAL